MTGDARALRQIDGQSGFSLTELLVSLLLTAIVLVVSLTAFDASSRLAQSQLDIANLQQNVRIGQRDIARYVRMAGRGGLPRTASLQVEQNVPVDTVIGGAAKVVPESDILRTRGVFNSPLFRVDASEASNFVISGNTATLVIDSMTRSGYEQPLDALKALDDEFDGFPPEPIILVSRQSDAIWAVVELSDIAFSDITVPVPGSATDAERATISLVISEDEGTHTSEYLALSSGASFPAQLTSVAFAGVLEEFLHYVRELRIDPGDLSSPLAPKLVRARMVPGTDFVHPAAGSLSLEIADRILDLQASLGIDLDGDGLVDELAADGSPLDTDADEWLWNDEGDDSSLAWDTSPLLLVRAALLGRTARGDRQYIDEPIAAIANRAYAEPSAPATEAQRKARQYRRRLLVHAIRPRNTG